MIPNLSWYLFFQVSPFNSQTSPIVKGTKMTLPGKMVPRSLDAEFSGEQHIQNPLGVYISAIH